MTVQDFEIADTTWQNITYRHFTALQNLVAGIADIDQTAPTKLNF